MFRILIVDDEKKHRSGLMKMLYTIYPEDMLLEADSGEQALEIMKLLECDIVITDICMPGIDGIGLLSRMRQEYADTRLILLSGFGEFDYAREAIRYGASGYLLKPVTAKEMKECLDQVRAEIEEQRRQEAHQKDMKNQLIETEAIYMEYLMQQFVRNETFDKKERVREVFPLEQPGFLFLCEGKGSGTTHMDVQEFRLTIKSFFKEKSSYSFEIQEKNRYAVIVLGDSKPGKTHFEQLKRELEHNVEGYEFAFFVSGFCENMYTDANRAYREAEKMRAYHFYELGFYCDYVMWEKRFDGVTPKLSDLTGSVVEKVKQNEIMGAYQQIWERIQPKELFAQPQELCRGVMLFLFQIVKNVDAMLGDEVKQKTDQLLTRVYEAETISVLLRRIYSFLLEIGKDIGYQKEIKGVDVLEHCREYLDKHFMEEITLETVAEKYYFNASYFSKAFKDYFGKNFSNYVIELRMKKAKELLTTSDAKIKEITNKVGYRDANYFIRAFKKYYGYTPEEFRKMKAQDKL